MSEKKQFRYLTLVPFYIIILHKFLLKVFYFNNKLVSLKLLYIGLLIALAKKMFTIEILVSILSFIGKDKIIFVISVLYLVFKQSIGITMGID